MGDPVKILLVDDEPDFLEVMGSRIRTWGHKLLEAKDGTEAVQTVQEKAPDIIILDYMLPGGMDGISTLKEIRKIDAEVPVIMFTAYPNIKAMKGAEKLGISAFIPKLSVYSDAQTSLKAAIEMVCKKIDRKKKQ